MIVKRLQFLLTQIDVDEDGVTAADEIDSRLPDVIIVDDPHAPSTSSSRKRVQNDLMNLLFAN